VTPTSTRSVATAILWACLLAARVSGQPSACDERNLLENLAPTRTVATFDFHYMTDARVAAEGAPWDSPFAGSLEGEGSFVRYDLGNSTLITASTSSSSSSSTSS